RALGYQVGIPLSVGVSYAVVAAPFLPGGIVSLECVLATHDARRGLLAASLRCFSSAWVSLRLPVRCFPAAALRLANSDVWPPRWDHSWASRPLMVPRVLPPFRPFRRCFCRACSAATCCPQRVFGKRKSRKPIIYSSGSRQVAPRRRRRLAGRTPGRCTV